jgi:hypothetical protein
MTTSPNSDLSETSSAPALLSSDKSAWQDPEADSAARLDALIAEMSLPEKLAQLGSVWLGFDVVTGDVAPMQNVLSRNASWPEAGSDGIGHLTRVFGTKPVRLPTACNGFGTCSGRWWNRHGWASPRPSSTRMPYRVHHLPGDGLSDGLGVGRDLRSRPGVRDGLRDRS